MGRMMMQDDVYIGTFFDLLNLRFAPSQQLLPVDYEHIRDFNVGFYDGIEEMKVLQEVFQIFVAGRSFKDSVAILNLGGLMNTRAKARWYALLADLKAYPSNLGPNSDADIVQQLIANLQRPQPLPVHFKAHDSRQPPGPSVSVAESTPIFYMDTTRFLTISLPMKPRDLPAAAAGQPPAPPPPASGA